MLVVVFLANSFTGSVMEKNGITEKCIYSQLLLSSTLDKWNNVMAVKLFNLSQGDGCLSQEMFAVVSGYPILYSKFYNVK